MKTAIAWIWKILLGTGIALGLFCSAAAQIRDMPSAVVADPPRDAAHPMRNEAVWIPSGGVKMNGVMFVAAGIQPHPTALLLHGLPGNEQNLDLAQVLRRAGYNVLTLHYRGSWGSPGRFTLAGGVDDGQAAMAFLQDPASVAKFHIDPKHLIIIGHSYGGFVSARVAASHPESAAVVFIAPWSPAQDVPALSVPPANFAAAAHSAFDDVEGRLGEATEIDLAKEVLSSSYDFHLESSAPGLKNLPVLIVVAKQDSADDQATELISALKAAHASRARTIQMDTDHPFSDHRIKLESVILRWLQAMGSESAK
jgi:uncharacterized protein